MADLQSQLTPDAFVAYASKGKLVRLVLGSGVFVAIGIALWFQGSVEYRVVGAAGVIFFGFAALFAVKQLLRRVPSLIVNEDGIFDDSSAYGAYMLRWEEVDSIYTSSVHRQRFISIRVRNLEGFMGRQPSARAKLMRANVKLVGAPVNISVSTLPVKLEELLEIINKKRQDAPAGRKNAINQAFNS